MRRRSSSPGRSTTGPATGPRSGRTATARAARGPPTSRAWQPGAEYRFTIRTGAGDLSRMDPYARHVTSSVGNGIVYDPAGFDWGDDEFEMPSWDDLVIYEMHVGTFAASDDRRGTFDDARRRLPYLERLGVSAVQVMPPFEFAGRHLVGLQPGPPVRHRVGLRRAGRVQALHPRRARPWHRGHRRRRLQPPRSVGPGPVAVRRLGRGRWRRDLLLQRRAGRSRRGARPGPTTVAARSARSCGTAR